MNKGFIFLGIVLVALFLVGCSTPSAPSTTGTQETTPLDSGIATLDDSSTDVNSVDSGLTDINSDINSL